MSYSPGNTHSPGLSKLDIEVRGLYPGEKYGAKMLYTPTANDARNSTLPESQRGRESRVGDVMRSQMLPTPNTPAGHCSGRLGEWGGCHNPFRGTDEGKGQLNPDWVELLMGFPLGWTEDVGGRTGKPVCPAPLPPDNSSDAPDCEPSATR